MFKTRQVPNSGFSIVMDLNKALLGNSSVNTIQQTGNATTEEDVIPMWSVPREYRRIREWEFSSVVGGDNHGNS
jgi:hypothetical protein